MKKVCFIVRFIKIKMQVQKCMIIRFIAFGCNKTGDIIQFVQYLFNLSFKEAMQKINEDFNLGLKSNTKIDYKKIKEIQQKRKEKENRIKELNQMFIELCSKRKKYYICINALNNNVTVNNWEESVYISSQMQMKCDLINLKLDYINEKLSSI